MEKSYMHQIICFKEESKYKKEYSEEKLLEKLKNSFAKAGISVVYGVLLLFYSLKDPNVPPKAKAIIIGALGYFISPIDLILDAAPGGYTDDLASIILALGIIAIYITDETKEKAREITRKIFNGVKDSDFQEIDKKIMKR